MQDCSCSQGLRISSLKWDLGKTDANLFPFILPIFNPVKPDLSNNSKQNLHFQNGIVSNLYPTSEKNQFFVFFVEHHF